jgi:hypothetical protein
MVGRVRVYVTTAEDPLDFGLPEVVSQAARAPAGERSAEQAAAIIEFYRSMDTEFWTRKQALMTAQAPLPVDPKQAELQTALANAGEPIKLDPQLAQMREDARMSSHQNENKRLTAVQDLAWALVNSGSFLFNH